MNIRRQTAQTYDQIASAYSATRVAHFWVNEFDFFKHTIDGKKVIDMGCGEGRDALVFIDDGFDYTGIDISGGMLKIAKDRVVGGKFQQMDYSETNFLAGEFDGFWAAASFIHTPKKDISGVLQEAKRITKTYGIGFISMKEKVDRDEEMVVEDKYGGISRYFSFYSADEFRNILENNSFSLVKFTTHAEGKNNWLCYFVKVQ